ncbi:MAG TPA: anaerobic sulfatase maturase [Acidisarcina sp.]|nr:anaerobic sulfatase maturase [Acidisarcina sp.]
MAATPFHILTKPIGPICNLDCSYCFYLEKETLYPGTSQWSMSPEVLDRYIQQYIQQQDTSTINFAWQGGEPTLLGIDYFRQVFALQQKYAEGKQITNAFQTNGVLLNDAWGELFAKNRVLVGISIDGPRRLHDRYRVDKGGQPTFDRVFRGIHFLKKHAVEFNTLTTVHAGNVGHPLEVYDFLRRSGSGFIQFIPIAERAAVSPVSELKLVSPRNSSPADVTPWSVDPAAYGEFLCAIFDEWILNDVGQIFVQLFDVSLEMWVGMQSSLCVFRPTCGSALAIEHNGDVYSCDHFVYPENRLGNIMEKNLRAMVDSPQQQQFGQEKATTLPNYCRECEVRFACNGECPKHRFATTPDGEPGLNYLCAAYKRFFTHVDPAMKLMADELAHSRPAANVMTYLRAQRAQATRSAPIPLNAPCPCGSGQKFKRCCGSGKAGSRPHRISSKMS